MQKYTLPFPLVADPLGAVQKAYRVPSTIWGATNAFRSWSAPMEVARVYPTRSGRARQGAARRDRGAQIQQVGFSDRRRSVTVAARWVSPSGRRCSSSPRARASCLGTGADPMARVERAPGRVLLELRSDRGLLRVGGRQPRQPARRVAPPATGVSAGRDERAARGRAGGAVSLQPRLARGIRLDRRPGRAGGRVDGRGDPPLGGPGLGLPGDGGGVRPPGLRPRRPVPHPAAAARVQREVFGSLFGILLFSLMSLVRLPPAVWFAFGALLLIPFLERIEARWPSRSSVRRSLAAALPASRLFAWSPYYKLAVEPIDVVYDFETGAQIRAPTRRPHGDREPRLVSDDAGPARSRRERVPAAARDTYTLPIGTRRSFPGRILVVGAGSGNDVSAALRSTDRPVDAVEIDRSIIDIGKALHAERPYQNPRVTIINDDARSFFQRTQNKYALVVFGFLDGHKLLRRAPRSASTTSSTRASRSSAFATAGPRGPALRLLRQQHAVDPPPHRQHDHRGVRSAHDGRRPRTRRGRRLPQREPARGHCRASRHTTVTPRSPATTGRSSTSSRAPSRGTTRASSD